jgi:hypothetical protein
MRTILAVVAVATGIAPAAAVAQEPPGTDDEDQPAADAGEDAETPTAAPAPAPAPAELDVDALRRRYFELRDKLFRSRARASAVASALYSTRIRIGLDYKSARHYTVTRAAIRLDGATVYDDSEGKIAADEALRFEGYVAPGRHRVSIRVEATGVDDSRFTSAAETTFTVFAVAGKDLVIRARAKDGGDIAYRWKKDTRGSYRLGLDVDVETAKPDARGSGRIKRASR